MNRTLIGAIVIILAACIDITFWAEWEKQEFDASLPKPPAEPWKPSDDGLQEPPPLLNLSGVKKKRFDIPTILGYTQFLHVRKRAPKDKFSIGNESPYASLGTIQFLAYTVTNLTILTISDTLSPNSQNGQNCQSASRKGGYIEHP